MKIFQIIEESSYANQKTCSFAIHAKTIIFIFNLVHLFACSHSLTLKSEPAGAKIFQMNDKGERGKLIGETPLELGNLKNLADNSYYSLEITKDGYDTRLFFSPIVEGDGQEFVVKLRALDKSFFESQFKKDRSIIINNSFGALLSLQAAVIAQNAQQVIELSKALEPEFDQISWFHSLLGNFYYLSGNKPEALKRYERAAELDPTNSEAASMLRVLRVTRPPALGGNTE